jgi:hypothetical protein
VIPGSYVIGYIYDMDVAHSWHRQLMNLVNHEMSTRQRLVDNGIIGRRCPSDGLGLARTMLVKDFLMTEGEWLLWMDTDMGFAPHVADQLLAAADKDTRPIVGALCFMQSEVAPDGMGGYHTRPSVTIFDWVEEDGHRYLMNKVSPEGYPVNSLVECGGTGSAMVLIHRRIFEEIQEREGPVWYERILNTTGVLVSEDLSFCMRSGVPVYVHTGVKTSHLKRQWVQESDYWRMFRPPPADEPVAVIVPVMNRPDNAAPFMQSLRASTGLATVYAVTDANDYATRDAWQTAGAQVLTSDKGYTFAKKANYGYEVTTEPYLFLCGDDVKFWPGWYDHALYVMKREQVGVVGTNDLGNSAVMAGEHATHPLFSRAYVDEHGASWDGPKVLCHEGYGHCFVDNEWTWVARQRGQFGFALGSFVEHRHPIWGKGEEDATYKRGQASLQSDQAHFQKRVNRFVRGAA